MLVFIQNAGAIIFSQLTIKHRKVLHPISKLIQNLILAHAIRVMVSSETNDYETIFLIQYCLVDMPASSQMREDGGTHSELW